MQQLDIKWIRLNTQRRSFKAEHEQFYPLYDTELMEAVETLKEYAHTKDRLKTNQTIKELIDFLKDNNRALTRLTKDMNTGMNLTFYENILNDIIPLKYGMPIIENIYKGAEIVLASIQRDIGEYAHARAIIEDHAWHFNNRKSYRVPKPDMSMFYPDFEAQDKGVTTDRDVNMPLLSDTDAVKTLPNGDFEIRVYLIFDRNRPRTSQSLGGKRYIIKDGVNRYKKACEQWEADKKAWYSSALIEYKQEHARTREQAEKQLHYANNALNALNTMFMPISLLATLVGAYNTSENMALKKSMSFYRVYKSVVNTMDNLTKVNGAKFTPENNVTKQQLADLNDIACRYTSWYGHETRASQLYYELKQSA